MLRSQRAARQRNNLQAYRPRFRIAGPGRRIDCDSFCYSEATACNDDYHKFENKLAIEARLIRDLRQWSVDPAVRLDEARTVEEDICGCLEWFIGGCISYDPSNRLGGWWSDGVVYLQIQRQNKSDYKLLGVTWIGCDGTAPFDIDVTLSPDDDEYFQRCLFRIGMLDRRGLPMVCAPNWAVGRVLDMRPRSNRDWAMAVELTPPHKD